MTTSSWFVERATERHCASSASTKRFFSSIWPPCPRRAADAPRLGAVGELQHGLRQLLRIARLMVVHGRRELAHGPHGGGVGADHVLRAFQRAALEEVRAEEARLHGRREDAQGGQLDGQRLGQPFDRELRRAIDAPAREGGIADDRRDVDDVTLARAAQMGQDGAGDLEQAEDIGLELALDLLRGRLLDRGQQAVAGVVDEDVDAAEAVDRCLGGGDGPVPRR